MRLLVAESSQSCHFLGASVMLSPGEVVLLNPEDTATEMVCVDLVNPEQVQRSVNLTFTFTAQTAGQWHV